MTMGVFDFKAIKRKLDCQEQKAEFEEKNPPVDIGMYGYPSNLTPMHPTHQGYAMAASKFNEEARKYMAENSNGFNLPDVRGRVETPLKSLAHPAWPYTGTPHEWRIKI